LGSLSNFFSSVFKKNQQRPSEEEAYVSPSHWKTGDVFGDERMEIKGIAEGGMGVVFFLGPRNQSGVAQVAKTFKDEFMRDEDAVSRFWHEAQSWIELGKHKNIVQAKRVFEVEGKPYIFLEFMDRGSLRKMVTKPMPLKQVLDIAVEICAGMEYAWKARSLIHRDLKPENILLNSNGEVKVTDWGLAKIFAGSGLSSNAGLQSSTGASGLHRTKLGVVFGTPLYMPPEQFEDPRSVNPTADIYALGVMMYEMLVGRLPFVGSNVDECYLLHKTGKAEPITRLRHDVPSSVNDCVMKALAKNPRDRFKSFAEFGNALLRLSGQSTGGSSIEKKVETGDSQMSSEDLAQAGFGLLHLRRDSEAIAYFDRAIRADPRNYAAYGWKSYCLGNLGRHQEAIEAARKALEINPLFGHAWGNLGFSYSSLGQHENAIKAYEKAVSLEPIAANYNNFCIALIDAKRYKEAIDCARKGLAEDPQYYRLWMNLSSVLLNVSKPAEAVDAAKNALRINPRARSAWTLLAKAYQACGKNEEASRCLVEASKIDDKYVT
jgi:serine/threonine protein kinase